MTSVIFGSSSAATSRTPLLIRRLISALSPRNREQAEENLVYLTVSES
jgi:hypothetical protein